MKQVPQHLPAIVPGDKELRSRVKLLGTLLGEALRQHAGQEVYDAVETLRKGFIRLRKTDSPARRQRLIRVIDELDGETLTHVVRAFSTYFSLVNIAEEGAQHRQRRRRRHSGDPFWTGSFHTVLREFRDAGLRPDDLQTLFDRLRFTPVITAHPTESRRTTINYALRRVFLASKQLDAPVTHRQREGLIAELRTQIQILWKTDEVRVHVPQVRDEIRKGLSYFHDCLFEAIPRVYRNLERAVRNTYGSAENPVPLTVPSFIRFGSWIGGDRDGNPNVRPETTVLALRLQTRMVLVEYMERITQLLRMLTLSSQLCTISEALHQSLDQERKTYDELFRFNPDRFEHEPYCRKMHVMHYRLERNVAVLEERLANGKAADAEHGYANEDEFLHDLYMIRDSLVGHGDAAVADGELRDLIRLAESCGFFLARLDVRQESSRHAEAVAEILALEGIDYPGLPENERLRVLGMRIARPPGPLDREGLSPATAETLEVFAVMARMRRELSEKAFGSYVVSMTHAASHVLEVLFLGHRAGLAGCRDGQWWCDLRVAPLFETIEDLDHIQPVLQALLGDPTYSSLLAAGGNLQEVMLGYSDSCKDGGIVAAAWALYEAQKAVTALTACFGVRCCLFHGRGGTIGRGGGPTYESIVSQPAGTVHGRIKFTEQGEVLSYKYSNFETAVYELTMGISGLIKASRGLVQPVKADRRDYLGTMDELKAIGEAAYRKLICNTPGFLDYFYEVTPVREIAKMNIGSRPSHRSRSDRSLESIRAIAWVFGWAQARHTLPAWYGIGTALERWRENDPSRLARLQRMYLEWPFFRALLSNTQMALFKAEMTIAEYYSTLAQKSDEAVKIFAMIREEYERTVRQVLNVSGSIMLLEDNLPLMLSLSRRNPYLDPLNHIQRAFLARIRQDNTDQEPPDTVLRTINAIAAGMRNTG